MVEKSNQGFGQWSSEFRFKNLIQNYERTLPFFVIVSLKQRNCINDQSLNSWRWESNNDCKMCDITDRTSLDYLLPTCQPSSCFLFNFETKFVREFLTVRENWNRTIFTTSFNSPTYDIIISSCRSSGSWSKLHARNKTFPRNVYQVISSVRASEE